MSASAQAHADAAALGGDFYPARWTRPGAHEGGEVLGIADLHAHPMAHLAFGGGVMWGEPDGPPHLALRPCAPAHGWRSLSLAGLVDGPRRHRGGYPDFNGWPTFDGRSHQQMYIDWIRRAHAAGLRLMVAFALNNELLAWLTRARHPYDDGSAIETQVAATKAFANRHQDLLAIALSPTEARRIIGEGRLAIVLGAEVDSVIEIAASQGVDTETWLERLYDLGIRHVFPVHLTDNLVGGAALYHPMFEIVNRHVRGVAFTSRVQRDLDFRVSDAVHWRWLAGRRGRRHGIPSEGHGHANARGLTAYGRDVVLPALMRLGIVLDIDHMSAASVADTLAVAEREGYPLVAGHAAFRSLALPRVITPDPLKNRNEYQRSDQEVRRMLAGGGLLAVGWNQREVAPYSSDRCTVTNDCAGSAKSWAQAYLYLLDHAPGAVAWGSDSNGLAGAPGPRFGPRAASGIEGERSRRVLRRQQAAAQRDAVRYADSEQFDVPVADHPALTPCRLGSRTFDLNLDGVAHYGMLPDFLQDLRNVGVTADALEPLYRSAGAYIRLWERVYRAR